MYTLPLLLVTCFSQGTHAPGAALEVAIATVEHQEAALRSFQIDFTTHAKSLSLGSNGQFGEQQGRWNEQRRGPLYRSRSSIKTGDGSAGVNDTTENGFDGTSYRQYLKEAGRASIGSANGVDQPYFSYVYAYQGPLSELLRQAAASGDVSWATLAGDSLLQCRFVDAAGATRTLYLDPAHGWQPRRILIEQAVPAGTYPDGRTAEVSSFVISKFLVVDGIVFPSAVHAILEKVGPDGVRSRVNERRLSLVAAHPNPELPDSTFTIAFPKGTEVYDRDRDVLYVEGVGGTERSVNARSTDSGGLSVLAVPGAQGNWWADFRLWVPLAAVVIAALAGIVTRQRRRGEHL